MEKLEFCQSGKVGTINIPFTSKGEFRLKTATHSYFPTKFGNFREFPNLHVVIRTSVHSHPAKSSKKIPIFSRANSWKVLQWLSMRIFGIFSLAQDKRKNPHLLTNWQFLLILNKEILTILRCFNFLMSNIGSEIRKNNKISATTNKISPYRSDLRTTKTVDHRFENVLVFPAPFRNFKNGQRWHIVKDRVFWYSRSEFFRNTQSWQLCTKFFVMRIHWKWSIEPIQKCQRCQLCVITGKLEKVWNSWTYCAVIHEHFTMYMTWISVMWGDLVKK